MARVLVTGASGNVGRVVARALDGSDVEVVRAQRLSHDGDDHANGGGGPDHASIPLVVPFDFADETTWGPAFEGVDGLFLVRPPAIGDVKRDLLPAVAAARAAGVGHVVFLSLQGAERNRVVPHHTVEQWLRQSGMSFTFVRASFFHQNLTTTHVSDIRDRDEIVVPAGRGRTAFVDAVDVGEVAAAALLAPQAHAGRAWTVTGPEALGYDEVAEILTQELGRPISYTRPGVVRYARHARTKLGMPWPMVVVTSAIYTSAKLGFADGLTDGVATVLGRAPVSFAEFAHRERAAWQPI